MSIPETVRHEDFLVAIEPLLTLLGVTAPELLFDLHIVAGVGKAKPSISFQVVATASEPREGLSKQVISVKDLAPPPRLGAALAWPISVEVV